MKGACVTLLAVVLLAGCGGHKQATEATDNPLQNQVDAINSAKAVQGVLDKDAAQKKKALENLN